MKRITEVVKHLFIPLEQNNFRAKILHVDFLTYYLIFALVLTVFYKKIGTNFSNILGFATDVTVEKLLQETNNERQKHNLNALSYNQYLANAAKMKAQDMFVKNYWSHYAPNGATPWDFILNSGYKYEYAGENLAKNFLFSQGIVSAWMASKTHRENILRKEYTEVGFAVVNGILNGEETTLVVQMFGKPMENTSQIAKDITPEDITIEQEIIKTPVSNVKPVVLAKNDSRPKINLLNLSLDMNFIFLSLLILAILMDLYIATKFNIIRISGKNLAHLIFVGIIFIGLIILTKGAII